MLTAVSPKRGLSRGLLSAVAVATACAGASERPPVLEDCSRCGPEASGARALPSGSGGAGGTGSEPFPGGSSMGGASLGGASMDLGERSGRVRLLRSPALEPSALTEPARVAWADDESQRTDTDSDGSFVLEGLLAEPSAWLVVTAVSGDPAWYPALQQVSLAQEPFLLDAILRSVLEETAEAGLSLATAEFDPLRSHLVVRFVGGAREPRAGVSLLSVDGAAVQAAYDAGDLYTDAIEATGERGVAFVLNLAASEPPGRDVVIRFQSEGGVVGDQRIRLSSGRTTIAWVELP